MIGPEIAMSEDLLEILAGLARRARAKVYVVGGYLRDRLLDREPVDLDLLVEGSPAPFLHAVSAAARFDPIVFSRREPVTYRVAMNDWLVDISACRAGGLTAALQRRDFTINALAAPLRVTPRSPAGQPRPLASLGEIIDPLGGLDDLKARRIRHIATEALDEDPLRLLRAVRLAVILEGFTLDSDLRRQLREKARLIDAVPVERILPEMEVVMASPRAGAGLRMMADFNLLFQLFPELKPLEGLRQNRWHRFDALEHTLRCVEEADALQNGHPALMIDARLGVEDAEVLKWSSLYHDTGKAATARMREDGEAHFYGHETISAQLAVQALGRLRAGSRKIERIRKLIENHLRLTLLSEGEASEKALRRIVNQLKYDTPLLCL